MYTTRRIGIILFFACYCCIFTYGQKQQQSISLLKIIKQLREEYGVQFNYQSNLLEDIKVIPLEKATTLSQKLKNLERQTSFKFRKVGKKIITVIKTFSICGFVLDKTLKTPLEGATIKGNHEYTISDKNGYFQLGNLSFNEVIEIRFYGFKPYKVLANNLQINPCKPIYIEEKLETVAPVIIKGYLVNGMDKSNDGSWVIDFSRFSTLPGLIETDVLQTIQALPGIQSTDETVSNINIRGGSHDQNLILWDGIKMYQSGHFFGLISGFNSQITKKVSVITNGSDASLSDGVSGTIQMKTDTKIQKEFTGNVGLNFVSTDLFLDIPLGKKSSIQMAGRKSNDWLQTPTYDRYFERVTQLTEIALNEESVIKSNQSFDFFDASARWLYNLSEKDKLRINFICLQNDLSFNETSDVSGIQRTLTSNLSQYSIAGGMHYTREWNSRFLTQFHMYETDYKLKSVNANVRGQQEYLQENIVSETNVKFHNSFYWNTWNLHSGYQFTETKITNLNDIDFPRYLRLKSDVIREHALFLQANYANKASGFSLKPGLRLNYIEKFQKYLIEPRFAMRQKFNPHFQLELLGEIKHQNSTSIVNFQNDFLGVEKRRWQLANNEEIPIIKSEQLSFGATFANKGWLFDMQAYYKKVEGITTQSQDFTTKYEYEKAVGSYRIVGFDFLLRKNFKNINTWLSYSMMKNDYQFLTLPDTEFPSNFDTTNALTFGSVYTKEDLKLSLGFNYRTGKPTSVPLENQEVINNAINYDRANNTRMEDYMRVDTSANYTICFSDKFKTEIGISIWNLLGKKNKISNFYQISSEGTPTKFSKFSLDTTFNIMVRMYF